MDRATIINHLLSVIGESGVSAITSTHPSVQTASRILDTEDVDFQQTGWWFNTEYRLTLVPNGEGRVIVPAAALDLRMSDVKYMQPSEKLRYARRGGLMYDTYEHTTVINKALIVDLVVQLPIPSMPPVASSYLMHKAAESIFIDDDGDTFKSEKLKERRTDAWTKLKAKELTVIAANALDNPFSRSLHSGIGGASRNPNLIGGLTR